ncbi:hypothetical protein ADUPG1_013429, partial [Aduncisulcus paluster]
MSFHFCKSKDIFTDPFYSISTLIKFLTRRVFLFAETYSGHKRKKHDSKTLTSASALESLCRLGEGGFGEVNLVAIKGIDGVYVLKKMLRVGDKGVIEACRQEFDTQVRLFMNPRCFNRIPRPMYILDLLDEKYEGVYGFCMEYCRGGSVKDFAKS